MLKQKSYVLKKADQNKKWYLVDAAGQTVGRLAVKIANVLRGKSNPRYTPTMDSGDYVVVINAEKVKFTGRKWEQKNYYWHTPYVGSLKKRTAKESEAKYANAYCDAVKELLPVFDNIERAVEYASDEQS